VFTVRRCLASVVHGQHVREHGLQDTRGIRKRLGNMVKIEGKH
jgi:hypothetical protein